MTKILVVLKSIYRLLESMCKVAETDTLPVAIDVNQLMTRMAVIAKLGISERTYNRWVKNGILAPIKMGNKHFYREEDLKDAVRRSINKGLI
ncbi:helix-turn-helix domain-containing protein [Sphingobacterium yanglingense]|nr:helix-turn-helix domain-containing protein [Sphingobacterium yanglingense]